MTLLLVSQSPLAKLQACRRRTGLGYLSQSRAASVFTLVGGAVDPKPDSRLECGRWTADPHALCFVGAGVNARFCRSCRGSGSMILPRNLAALTVGRVRLLDESHLAVNG